jgi:integrase
MRRSGSIVEHVGKKGATYRAKFDVPSAAPGAPRRTVYSRTFKTRKEAERELRRLQDEAERGVKVDAASRTLTSWIEEWLASVTDDVSRRTFERYAELLRHHVVPHIGHRALRQIEPLEVERLYRKLGISGWRGRPKPGAEPTVKGLAPRTVKHVHRALFSCLKDAARLRLIGNNPLADARVKRKRAGKPDPNGQAATMKVVDRETLARLLDAARKQDGKSKNLPYALVLLALDSGARRGELLALRWSDINLDRRTIRIDRAVDDTKENGITIKDEPKNESSRRTVTISGQTAETLRAHWRGQTEIRLALGLGKLPEGALAFPLGPKQSYEPLRPREVTKAFARFADSIGLAGLRFHDLRHNCASHLLKAGKPVPDVARHLGHSTPAITMAVYAHAIPQADGGAGLLDELLPGRSTT